MKDLSLQSRPKQKKVIASFVWKLKRWRVESALIEADRKLSYEEAYALLLDANPWLKQVPRGLVRPSETLMILESMAEVLPETPSSKQEAKIEITNETNTASPSPIVDANGGQTSIEPPREDNGVQGASDV